MLFLIIIAVISSQVFCSQDELDYCHVSNIPGCLNKTHLMCKVDSKKYSPATNKTIESVLRPLNENRKYVRLFHFITNLQDFEWNTRFEEMAREILKADKSSDYCTITRDYKNIFILNDFSEQNANTIADNAIELYFQNRLKTKNPETSWMASAYSTQIGCSKSFGKRFACCINGVELSNPTQSYIYKNDRDFRKSVYNNKKCRTTRLPPCTDHFICADHKFAGTVSPAPLQSTSAKYILYKFEQNKQTGKWEYDLQHFAERIVANNLTEADKCLAHAYPKISTILLTGVEHFREQISNIDSVWQSNNISGGIGCATFTTESKATKYFNLYCLTGHRVQPHFIIDFLDWIELDRSDYWTIYILLILTFLNIVACLTLMHCIKVYEFNQIFNPS